MKTANIAIFTGVLVCVLMSSHASLYAQAIKTPIAIEDDDKPWNHGIPLATREVARSLFLEGNRFFYLPMYAKATEKYISALTKWKHPAFYFNLALAQLNLGQEVDAHENLKQAVRYGEEPLGTLSFREAQKQLENLERELGKIRVTCPTVGAEVTMDGTPLFTGPGNYEGWVQAKAHEIAARKRDYLPKISHVAVTRGELKILDLPLIAVSDAEETRWKVWKPWAVVAAGTAIAAGGSALHALSYRNFRTYDDKLSQLSCVTMPDPTMPGCRPQDIPRDVDYYLTLGRREQAIAIGSYIAGGTLIATGVILLYMNRPRLLEHVATNSSVSDLISIVPTLSLDTFGILVSVNH